MLSFNNGDVFTTGRARFADGNHEGPEATGKIFVRVEPRGFGGPVLALLDTGAAWSILNTEIAEELHLLQGEGELIRISTRLGLISGRLESVAITVVADDGQSLDVDATFLVSADWPMPTFLGYAGLLERIRFAIDPQENHFHFGGYLG